ncbi:MAG: type II toxin-antitoxin system VapC family toxin [Planctomycetes bacterium]|nr:type II toxin-antitoxin system VapC family toxin [Planctomycetota bacterium]
MNLTVDASVFVAAARDVEPHHAESLAFLHELHVGALRVSCPTIVLPESAAAIARRTGDDALTDEAVELILSLAGLQLLVVDFPLAERAVELAKAHRLRGADAIYVAVADASKATLVAWDSEMLVRGGNAVPTMTPSTWLAQYVRP